MSLTTAEVERIAHLARIRLEPTEVTQIQSEFDGIFKLIDEMQAVNTQEVATMTNGLDVVLRLRDDAVTEQNQREKLQKNAPQAAEGYFLVPKVIE